MSDKDKKAVEDARAEYRTLYGQEPDEKFETLLSRAWRDGYDVGRGDAYGDVISYAQEAR